MRIANEALDEFIELYKKEFGEDVSRDDAAEVARRLVTMYDALCKSLLFESAVLSAAESPDRVVGFRVRS